MDLFTNADLRMLMNTPSAPHVSVYLPTHRTGREIREDALRCKNALREAEVKLGKQNLRSADVAGLLRSAWQMQRDGSFWQAQSDGLAMFASPDTFRIYRVPLSFEQSVQVGNRFHVKPMLPLLEGDGKFYLLALSQKHVRLFRGSKFNIDQLAPTSLPRSLQDALHVDEYMQSLQFYTYRPAGSSDAGQGEQMFHGHGGAGKEVQKRDEIREFLLRVSKSLQDLLATDPQPLVFAGVKYLLPMLSECLNNPLLLSEPVSGNPDELSAAQLHSSAWKIVSTVFDRQRREKLDEFHNKAGTGLASSQIEQIVVGAQQGALDTLFVADAENVWGVVDENSGLAVEHAERQEGDQDLLDLAAVHCLLNGGRVYTLEREAMPTNDAAAAIYRHAIAPTTSTQS